MNGEKRLRSPRRVVHDIMRKMKVLRAITMEVFSRGVRCETKSLNAVEICSKAVSGSSTGAWVVGLR